MLVQLDKNFPLDRIEQGMRDGLIYKRVELEEGVMYEQLLRWAGIARLFRNNQLYIEVPDNA